MSNQPTNIDPDREAVADAIHTAHRIAQDNPDLVPYSKLLTSAQKHWCAVADAVLRVLSKRGRLRPPDEQIAAHEQSQRAKLGPTLDRLNVMYGEMWDGADTERMHAAADRADVLYVGCDTPEHLADRIAALTRERDEADKASAIWHATWIETQDDRDRVMAERDEARAAYAALAKRCAEVEIDRINLCAEKADVQNARDAAIARAEQAERERSEAIQRLIQVERNHAIGADGTTLAVYRERLDAAQAEAARLRAIVDNASAIVHGPITGDYAMRLRAALAPAAEAPTKTEG